MRVLRRIGYLARCLDQDPQDDVHPIRDAAIAWQNGRIAWVGREDELPLLYQEWPSEDAGGMMVIPGLIDCHTHLAFGGWRGEEFAERLRGRSYEEIAAAGGGILSTMRRTRALSHQELVARSGGFLAEMASLGVTTVECKSGYGLDEPTELRLLEVYAALASSGPQRIVSTLLAAHAVPPEYRDGRAGYVHLVSERIIPEVAGRGLASFCDIFVEGGAFTPAEARTILRAGQRHGLRSKLHVDQLQDGGGASLAAELGAISADHLEHASTEGIAAIRASGTVAVSLPLASLYLGKAPMPARQFLDAGVPVAVATDFNPGSAPSWHLPLAMMLACTLQRMTPAEALRGATSVAARALGLEGTVGSLEPNKAADVAIIDAPDPNHWLYQFRPNACCRTIVAGETVPAVS